MPATITIEELQAKLKRMSADMVPTIEKAMKNKVTPNVKAKAKDNINPATTPYYRPAYITGKLSGSISDEVEVKGNTVIGTVGAGANYAKKIHEGSYKGGQPRPFILDAIKSEEEKTVEFLSDAVKVTLKKHCV